MPGRSCLPRPPAAPSGPPEGEAAAAAVCVVDDDPGVRDSLRVMLEAYGFAVATCRSGSEFLADGRHRRVSCLVIDQHMPEISGLDVFAALQQQGFAVPTVLVTAGMAPAIAQRARALGVTAVLEKPFAASRLVDLVRPHLARAK